MCCVSRVVDLDVVRLAGGRILVGEIVGGARRLIGGGGGRSGAGIDGGAFRFRLGLRVEPVDGFCALASAGFPALGAFKVWKY